MLTVKHNGLGEGTSRTWRSRVGAPGVSQWAGCCEGVEWSGDVLEGGRVGRRGGTTDGQTGLQVVLNLCRHAFHCLQALMLCPPPLSKPSPAPLCSSEALAELGEFYMAYGQRTPLSK